MAAALPVEGRVLARLGWAGQTTTFFEHSLPLTMHGSSGAFIGCWSEIFNRPPERNNHEFSEVRQRHRNMTFAILLPV